MVEKTSVERALPREMKTRHWDGDGPGDDDGGSSPGEKVGLNETSQSLPYSQHPGKPIAVQSLRASRIVAVTSSGKGSEGYQLPAAGLWEEAPDLTFVLDLLAFRASEAGRWDRALMLVLIGTLTGFTRWIQRSLYDESNEWWNFGTSRLSAIQ
ncbi:hypothetical protein AK812_SmicGene4110 [Symbiodinium microadriaticum]|uniref:Uncharacterized protein n=1 Tax=Symbiodinium microadriaticum TaxID=2951 RepID=A0A1Q9EX63_SYMMI|nr:hypothetical protein AK812_SmicGene4110 [Symbiodinium microadriaticum]